MPTEPLRAEVSLPVSEPLEVVSCVLQENGLLSSDRIEGAGAELGNGPGARERPIVLVAEDDREIRELIAVALERAGYEVVAVADGEEAVEAARQRRPDLALLDGRIPRLDGYEVIRRLRANPATHDIPIGLLSARALRARIGAQVACN